MRARRALRQAPAQGDGGNPGSESDDSQEGSDSEGSGEERPGSDESDDDDQVEPESSEEEVGEQGQGGGESDSTEGSDEESDREPTVPEGRVSGVSGRKIKTPARSRGDSFRGRAGGVAGSSQRDGGSQRSETPGAPARSQRAGGSAGTSQRAGGVASGSQQGGLRISPGPLSAAAELALATNGGKSAGKAKPRSAAALGAKVPPSKPATPGDKRRALSVKPAANNARKRARK